MRTANTVEVSGSERLEQAQDLARAQGRGLLTYSNHVSLFDDPWLTACFVDPPWEHLRWVAADSRNFFGSSWKAALFNAGKCVPIVRGAGIEQPGMAFLEQRLRAGDWVHVFPEGGRTREPGAQLRRPFKTGMAHLIRAAAPVLLPFAHRGMEQVLPLGAWLPRTGQRICVAFGAPVESERALAARSVAALTRHAEETLTALAGTLAEPQPSVNSRTRVKRPQAPQRTSRSSQEFPFGELCPQLA